MHDNKRVPFRYEGNEPERLHAVFGTYNGHVKAKCEVLIHNGSDVKYVFIQDFQIMHGDMFNPNTFA